MFEYILNPPPVRNRKKQKAEPLQLSGNVNFMWLNSQTDLPIWNNNNLHLMCSMSSAQGVGTGDFHPGTPPFPVSRVIPLSFGMLDEVWHPSMPASSARPQHSLDTLIHPSKIQSMDFQQLCQRPVWSCIIQGKRTTSFSQQYHKLYPPETANNLGIKLVSLCTS